jgi:hypothetical protein
LQPIAFQFASVPSNEAKGGSMTHDDVYEIVTLTRRTALGLLGAAATLPLVSSAATGPGASPGWAPDGGQGGQLT